MSALSFRSKLALAMGALILAISAAISFYLPRVLEREAIALIAHKGETLARLTAFTIHPALHFDDRAALEEALTGTRGDRDVAYVVVTDPRGATLAAFHPERAGAQRSGSPGGRVSDDRTLYEVTTPIGDGGREIARLRIGISLARLHASVTQLRITILGVSAAIFLAGMLGVWLISGVLTRPLRDVAVAARTIAAGVAEMRAPVAGSDEIGQLASAFNDMAVRVAERDASLRQSRDQLRHLSRRLLGIQEEERLRIAREVHDELGQALTALKIDLQQLSGRSGPLDESLAGLARTIDEIVDLVRRIATDLRPAILDDLGIAAALEQQLRWLRESAGIRTTLEIPREPALDRLTSATVYRIAQEALSNVARHAHASEVSVSLHIEGGAAVVEVRDNGRGIAKEAIASRRSLGLIGIRERTELLGGTVAVSGREGEGTVVRVTLPLDKEVQDAGTVR
ncbi:MAG: HAMP domain-containing sensor histidine kinase [Thermoanaerobaculia bacterium]